MEATLKEQAHYVLPLWAKKMKYRAKDRNGYRITAFRTTTPPDNENKRRKDVLGLEFSQVVPEGICPPPSKGFLAFSGVPVSLLCMHFSYKIFCPVRDRL